jgi:hypothetical protein
VSGVSPRRQKAAGLIEKETNEHRTSNTERPTSNNVFCLIYKKLRNTVPPIDILRFDVLRLACLKID